jgi:hypothetical protein
MGGRNTSHLAPENLPAADTWRIECDFRKDWARVLDFETGWGYLMGSRAEHLPMKSLFILMFCILVRHTV